MSDPAFPPVPSRRRVYIVLCESMTGKQTRTYEVEARDERAAINKMRDPMREIGFRIIAVSAS
jgi:hypothetical protein